MVRVAGANAKKKELYKYLQYMFFGLLLSMDICFGVL